jgi:DNA-binding NarL/FixJ family response regulator
VEAVLHRHKLDNQVANADQWTGGVLQGDKMKHLTQKQLDVLRLRVEGMPLKTISSELGRGYKGIESCSVDIGKAIGLHSVAEQVQFALVSGLVEPSERIMQLSKEYNEL